MAVSGGGDRKWLRPLPPRRENIIGSHQGSTEALNISNPVPNFQYHHARRDPNYIQRKLNEGWRPIPSESQERWGADIGDMQEKFPELDGLKAFQDVIAMRMPNDKYSRLMEERRRRATSLRTGATEEYEERGRQLAERTGNVGETIYYVGEKHGYEE